MEFFSAGFIWSHMGFYLLGVLLWGFIVISGGIFIWGFWKSSWKAFLISGIAFLIPAIILSTQHGWFGVFYLLPLSAFVLMFYTKNRVQI